VFVEDGLGGHYIGFATAYLAARSVNMLEWARAAWHVPVFRPIAARFMSGFALVAAIIVASMSVGPDARLVMWGIAVVLDIATPVTTMRRQATLPPISTSKFPERFGLFTIIVLGESIVGVINGVSELAHEEALAPSALLAAGLGVALGFGMWWVYFDFIARRPPRPVFSTALGWVYLHLAAVTAITVTGAGISAVIADQAHDGLRPSSQLLLTGGLGCALLALAALELTLHRHEHEPTHPVVSVGLKAAAGVLVLAVGWLTSGWSTVPLLVVLLVPLWAQAGYGAYVWFTRGPAVAQPA
jgi:low temperature requirement protein LtrA